MTRRNEDKRGNNELPEEHDRKVEARFTKRATAHSGQDGTIDGRKVGTDHATNGKNLPDKGPV